MDAIGASAALVVPAIPDVGRTTVGRHQLEGVPVHRTAFAIRRTPSATRTWRR
jgi:uncharacterized protein YgbK (DUF1537 family)